MAEILRYWYYHRSNMIAYYHMHVLISYLYSPAHHDTCQNPLTESDGRYNRETRHTLIQPHLSDKD